MQQTDLGLHLSTKRTRKREFFAQTDSIVPWDDLVSLVAPCTRESKTGRPPFAVLTMLHIHFMQQWFTLSDPAMEESLHDIALFREFAGLSLDDRLPDESTILRFRHLLGKYKLADQILTTVNELLQCRGLMLKASTVVDATLIGVSSSTKNKTGERDPEMYQTKKGNQWHFGMKAYIGVDVDSGMVHTVRGTATNVNDVVEGKSLLHGQESAVFADAGYQDDHKRPDAREGTTWSVATRPGKRKALGRTKASGQLTEQVEKIKASIRNKVEHLFRVIKQQVGQVKVRYRGLAKNTAQLKTLFALSNLWMARRKLLVLDRVVRTKAVVGA
jgi:IS5 family transposase